MPIKLGDLVSIKTHIEEYKFAENEIYVFKGYENNRIRLEKITPTRRILWTPLSEDIKIEKMEQLLENKE